MRKIILTLFVATTMLFGCEKSNQLCGGNDPKNDLPWLKAEIALLSKSSNCNSISRSTYKENTVFIFSSCDSSSLNSIPFLYDCGGKKLNLLPADYQELKFTGEIELIWKSN